jgi:hypothetical protein
MHIKPGWRLALPGFCIYVFKIDIFGKYICHSDTRKNLDVQ